MKGHFSLTYYDRSTGALLTEPVYAEAFLSWSYNTTVGRFMNDLFFRQKFFSKLYGWLHKQRWSRRKIRSFAQDMKVRVDELLRPLEDFTDFNDFFRREIDLSKRPINDDPRVCIAPADGKVLAYPVVPVDMTFQVKRGIFNLRQFVQDDALAKKFANGSMVVSRLSYGTTTMFTFQIPESPKKHLPLEEGIIRSAPMPCAHSSPSIPKTIAS